MNAVRQGRDHTAIEQALASLAALFATAGYAPVTTAHLLKADTLIDLYRHMTETRVFDSKAINLQRTGKLGTYASCLGHEATHVGIAAAMQADDVLAPSYREYGAMLYRGVTMAEILLYWGGDERGSDFAGPRDVTSDR